MDNLFKKVKMTLNYAAAYKSWLEGENLNSDEKTQLNALKNDVNAQKEQFGAELAFGTAGMRGILGMGTNRMNRFMVARATRGLAAYITERGQSAMERGVVISYDTRNFSTEFAIVAAEVLNDAGIKVFLFENVRPVPLCSYAVRRLFAYAGIMITASHNPAVYNGYKVYGSDGAQMSPEDTAVVVKYISAIDNFFYVPEKSGLTPQSIRSAEGKIAGNIKIIGKDIDADYYKEISALRLSPDAVKKAGGFKIVYTPLHGSGYRPVTEVLNSMGVSVRTVDAQTTFDGSFPTVKVPNPEEASALSMALELAERVGSDIVLGTDPDCDRMGAAIRNDKNEFMLLNGNQIGALLMDYILSRKAEMGILPDNAAVIRTIVTTRLADKIAADFKVKLFEVLTGFKFIGEKIKDWEQSGEYVYEFGFEESYGSLSGTHARDKDAVVAAMLFAEMACYYESVGTSVYKRLMYLFEKYGYYKEITTSAAFSGLDGLEKMKAITAGIRQNPLTQLGGEVVTYSDDYLTGIHRTADGKTEKLGLPQSDAILYGLSGDDWACVRPSGTEPKLKIYAAASRPTEKQANEAVSSIVNALKEKLQG